LQQDRITKQFSLGGKIYELGMIMADSSINRVVQVARPYVDALREELNETVAIEVWSGASTVVAYEAESNRPLRVVAGRLGKTPPVHAAAGARAILSVAEPTQIDAAFKGVLHRYTSSTITDVDILKGNLAQFKEQGFAVDRDELDIGISAVGAPIFDHQGKAIAAIVVLIPSPRFSDDPKSKTITELKAVSKTISGKFFYKDD
ncbi:MAG: IclR family transcriptional regulator, partial [Anaerolineae bacterium]